VPEISIDFGAMTRVDRSDLEAAALSRGDQVGAFFRLKNSANGKYAFSDVLTQHAYRVKSARMRGCLSFFNAVTLCGVMHEHSPPAQRSARTRQQGERHRYLSRAPGAHR